MASDRWCAQRKLAGRIEAFDLGGRAAYLWTSLPIQAKNELPSVGILTTVVVGLVQWLHYSNLHKATTGGYVGERQKKSTPTENERQKTKTKNR